MVTEIVCLRSTVIRNGIDYEMFVGSMPANLITSYSEVPAFSDGSDSTATRHQEIALNISKTPVKKWQRPEIESKINSIAKIYSQPGELMPNAILLAANVTYSYNDGLLPVNIQPYRVNNSIPHGDLYKIEIDDQIANQSVEKVFWILDGQHRVKGMKNSAHPDTNIPFVLLFSTNGAYSAGLFARIFALVSAKATNLNKLHKEWLLYAFDLDDYSILEHQKAMETVIELTIQQTYNSQNRQINNRFFDNIKFNPAKSMPLKKGDFQFDCVELKNLIFEHYYDELGPSNCLSPSDLAKELSLAYNSLYQTIPQNNHPNSVFFGIKSFSGKKRASQKPMHTGFIAGCLAKIVQFNAGPVNINWTQLFQTLMFNSTNWKFNWVKSWDTEPVKLSTKIAINSLKYIFNSGQLPFSSQNPITIDKYLQGEGLDIKIQSGDLGNRIQFPTSGVADHPLSTNSSTTIDLQALNHNIIRIGINSISPNVGSVKVEDIGSTSARPILYDDMLKITKGLKLNQLFNGTPLPNPLILKIHTEHYGKKIITLEIEIIY